MQENQYEKSVNFQSIKKKTKKKNTCYNMWLENARAPLTSVIKNSCEMKEFFFYTWCVNKFTDS